MSQSWAQLHDIDDGKKDILLGLKDYLTNVGIVWNCIEWKSSGESGAGCKHLQVSEHEHHGFMILAIDRKTY